MKNEKTFDVGRGGVGTGRDLSLLLVAGNKKPGINAGAIHLRLGMIKKSNNNQLPPHPFSLITSLSALYFPIS